jgi:predicted RNA-binding Zn ribbon-like protein
MRELRPDDQGRPESFFIAGAVGLDFLNSVATPVEVPVEWITSGNDLLDWLERAGLITSDTAAKFRRGALPGELDAVATQARVLREWFRDFVLAHKGEPLKPNALPQLESLNRLLARGEAFDQIVTRAKDGREEAGLNLRLVQQRRWRSPDALLLPIAKALADLVCEVNFANIKACEGPTCSLLYIDPTRAHARRWCSMAVCGNRRKQAAYRERSKKLRKRSKNAT